MAEVKKHLIKMLELEAEAQKAKALLTLEALQMLVDADDKLEAIKKYFL
jgi:hypothetical protein